MTQLFESTSPEVVHIKDTFTTRAKQWKVLRIDRPSRLGNPFPVGFPLTVQGALTCLAKVHWWREVLSSERLEQTLPRCYQLAKAQTTLSREQAIELFRELWSYSREQGFILDNEILNLAGKKLACHCKPRKCHGDIIVDDFIKLKQKVEKNHEHGTV